MKKTQLRGTKVEAKAKENRVELTRLRSRPLPVSLFPPSRCDPVSGPAYLQSREEPEKEVAVVLLVDGQVAGVALDVGSGQLPHQAQAAG